MGVGALLSKVLFCAVAINYGNRKVSCQFHDISLVIRLYQTIFYNLSVQDLHAHVSFTDQLRLVKSPPPPPSTPPPPTPYHGPKAYRWEVGEPQIVHTRPGEIPGRVRIPKWGRTSLNPGPPARASLLLFGVGTAENFRNFEWDCGIGMKGRG